jgi:hypothetical protein
MALSQWWRFSESMVKWEKDEAGVYEFCNIHATIIYIGSSYELRRRLRDHLAEPVSTCIRRNAENYRTEYTGPYKRREQELYDEFVRMTGRAPECNEVRP